MALRMGKRRLVFTRPVQLVNETELELDENVAIDAERPDRVQTPDYFQDSRSKWQWAAAMHLGMFR